MGIRNRTPIGTLREQRKSAESANQTEAPKPKALVAVRVRGQLPRLNEEAAPAAPEKTDHLLHRLRDVLSSDQARAMASLSDYQILQDELSRIVQHQQQSRADSVRELVDLTIPRKDIETRAPFRYVVIDGGKTSDDFPTIPKLDKAPTSFDIYTQDFARDPAPKAMPLTLLISPDSEKTPAQATHDPAQEAAQFTQNNVHLQPAAAKGSVLPKSLVLSLLDD